jgi:hypothetical protein
MEATLPVISSKKFKVIKEKLYLFLEENKDG